MLNLHASSLLWLVESRTEKYMDAVLFGTMHIKDQRAFKNIENVFPFIESSTLFVNELDLSNLGNIDFSEAFFLSEGKTLQALLGVKKFKKLRQLFLKAFQVDILLKPPFIPLMLAQEITASVFNKEASLSLDEFLLQHALEKGIRTSGLETIEEQVAVLNAIPLDYQIKHLLSLGRNVSKVRNQMKKQIGYYEGGEIIKLYKSTKRGLGSLRSQMLYDRNIVMADRLVHLQKDEKVFCAVGVAHLPGEKGLLKLLKDRGMRLTPLLEKP